MPKDLHMGKLAEAGGPNYLGNRSGCKCIYSKPDRQLQCRAANDLHIGTAEQSQPQLN